MQLFDQVRGDVPRDSSRCARYLAPLKQSSLKLGSLLTVRMRTNSRKVFSNSFSSLAAVPRPPPAPLEGTLASQLLLTAWLALLLEGNTPAAWPKQVHTN